MTPKKKTPGATVPALETRLEKSVRALEGGTSANKPGSHKDREHRARLLSRARDCFVRAAAATTESPIQEGALPLALMEGAMGMLFLAQADADAAAFDRVTAHLAALAKTADQ